MQTKRLAKQKGILKKIAPISFCSRGDATTSPSKVRSRHDTEEQELTTNKNKHKRLLAAEEVRGFSVVQRSRVADIVPGLATGCLEGCLVDPSNNHGFELTRLTT